jgi:hypothetical protein
MVLLAAVILLLMLGGAIFLAIALVAMQRPRRIAEIRGHLGVAELERRGTKILQAS